MALENELLSQYVNVEAHLAGTPGESRFYTGRFRGVNTISGKEVIVLDEGRYFNSTIQDSSNVLAMSENQQTVRATVATLYVPYANVLSIAKLSMNR